MRGGQRDNQPMTVGYHMSVSNFAVSTTKLINKSPLKKSYSQTLKTLAHHMQEILN
jgi:hypothetical protein